MHQTLIGRPVRRRTILKAGLAIGAMQVASPFVVKSLADEPVKIGLDNPLTGTFAALGKNELIGAQLALDQINANNGILGRKVELISEDTQSNVGVGVQKANKLLDRDNCDFLAGTVASNVSQAIAQVCSQKKKLFVVTGGHVDALTGKDCTWNVYRVCNTTYTIALATASALVKKYGKRWYFLTPDYAFGHTLQQGFEAALKQFDLIWQYYQQSRVDSFEVYLWSRLLLDASKGASVRPDRRIAAFEEHLDRMRKLEALIKKVRRLGFGRSSDVGASEYYRVEAECWLAEAKAR